MGSRLINLVGKRFFRLTVLASAGKNQHGHYRWLCQCDCGNKTEALGHSIKAGVTKSCGCLQRQVSSVVSRQTNFEGARRIAANGQLLTISQWSEKLGCEQSLIYRRMRNGMSPHDAVTTPVARHKPKPKRFRVTQYDESVTVLDESRTVQQWAEFAGVSVRSMLFRMNMFGPEEAVTMPRRGATYRTLAKVVGFDASKVEYLAQNGLTLRDLISFAKRFPQPSVVSTRRVSKQGMRMQWRGIRHNGQEKTLTELAKDAGMSYQVLHRRLCAGWTVRKAIETPSRQRGKKSK